MNSCGSLNSLTVILLLGDIDVHGGCCGLLTAYFARPTRWFRCCSLDSMEVPG